jgi:hypothetical protein
VFQLPDLLDGLSDNKARAEGVKPASPPVTAADGFADIQSLTGTYVLNRTLSEGTKIPSEGYIYVRPAAGIKGIEVEYWQTKDDPMRLIQVAPLLFRSVRGNEEVSFRTSKDNQRTYLIDYNVRGDGAFRRILHSDRPSTSQQPRH